jgi:undecaprenyl-diphosphatase
MTLLHAALLGIIQGLTEFLPVSSSGHLILARYLLGLPKEDTAAFVFDVLVQMGTWVALVIYYRHELLVIGKDMFANIFQRKPASSEARVGWLVLLATVPAVIGGWLLKDSIAGDLSSLPATGWLLLGTALLLVAAELFGRRQRDDEELKPVDAVWIGTSQILGLLPAISRSAATLFGGMTRNLRRPQAARFAFLMAVPIMPAAAVVAILQLETLPQAGGLLLPLAVGFLAATLVGYLTIRWLLNYLATRSLFPFALYCSVVGILVLIFAR